MFEGWGEFYLLIGSAAAALIGLLFVVVTLTNYLDLTRATLGERIYMTPVVFDFAVVLVLSALALAPELGDGPVAFVVLAAALIGVAVAIAVAMAIPRLDWPEPPHWTDFWFYGVAPAVCYLGLAGVGASILSDWAAAPLAMAVVLMAILLISIRNAWDLVTWLAPRKAAADLGDESP